MTAIETIEFEELILAIVMRGQYEPEGVNFVTPETSSLQLGILRHKKGAIVKPHVHTNLPRTISEVQEVLHVQRGKVEVRFFSSSGKGTRSVTLEPGDTILLVSGGHGLNILEDATMIEIKQGPYYGVESDKKILNTGCKTGE